MNTQIIGYLANPKEIVLRDARRRRRKWAEDSAYFIRQRLTGILMVITGATAAIITREGITASMLLIPFGIVLIISKEKMITDTHSSYEALNDL